MIEMPVDLESGQLCERRYCPNRFQGLKSTFRVSKGVLINVPQHTCSEQEMLVTNNTGQITAASGVHGLSRY